MNIIELVMQITAYFWWKLKLQLTVAKLTCHILDHDDKTQSIHDILKYTSSQQGEPTIDMSMSVEFPVLRNKLRWTDVHPETSMSSSNFQVLTGKERLCEDDQKAGGSFWWNVTRSPLGPRAPDRLGYKNIISTPKTRIKRPGFLLPQIFLQTPHNFSPQQ